MLYPLSYGAWGTTYRFSLNLHRFEFRLCTISPFSDHALADLAILEAFAKGHHVLGRYCLVFR